MAKERIGIMGGTFNPIHSGHIAMARAALTGAKLDRVLFLPDGVPPHKTGIAPAEDRWRMLCAAISQEEQLEPCRIELDRAGTTYTIDTLSDLHRLYPKADLFYIIGADTLMQLHSWRESEKVLRLCTFLVCPRTMTCSREDYLAERKRLTSLGASLINIDMDVMDVSSSDLREQLARGEATPLLPVTVREYCGAKGLYGMPRRVAQADEWMDRLFSDLTAKRFAHTLAVAYSARHLAMAHGEDIRKAEIAALLHDCAKCLPLKDMRRMYEEHSTAVDDSVLESGNLLHSSAGACMASVVYGVTDPEILNAIASHTTGRAGMTRLDMIVYLADKIEPTRADYPVLTKVRMMSTLSLEKALLTSMDSTAKYVRKGGKPLHPQTLETIEWLKTLPENKA